MGSKGEILSKVVSSVRGARLAAILLVCATLSAHLAGATPLPFVEQMQCGVTEPVCILVVPDGSGMTFSQARTITGDVVDATITLQIWIYDEYGSVGPDAGFLAEWLSLDGPNEQTRSCLQDYVTTADSDCDAQGWTAFSAAPRAGGWSQDPVEIYNVGEPASAYGCDCPLLPIYFNSPDISGDLLVDLGDVALFARDFLGGQAPFRSDLVWDGVIDLADVAVFSQHLGADCQ